MIVRKDLNDKVKVGFLEEFDKDIFEQALDCISLCFEDSEIGRQLNDPEKISRTVVALKDKETIGAAILGGPRMKDKYVNLRAIGVLLEHSRSGIGSNILSTVEEEVSRLGFPGIYVVVERGTNNSEWYFSRKYKESELSKDRATAVMKKRL